jgi:anti-sigma-K factor RskA
MTRLELIMTDKKLSTDDARALLGEHIEGTLEEDVRVEMDALLASDASLAAEHRRLKGTLSLLKALPAPEAPSDMVGKVRDRLAAERRTQSEGEAPVDNVVRPAWRRWGGIEAAIGLAAAASIAVFVAVAGSSSTGNGKAGDTAAAGIAADNDAVRATVVVPGIAAADVDAAAEKAGMTRVAAGSYEGGRREAARFLMALKTIAAERGVEMSGFVPDAEKVRVDVKAQ